MITKTMVIAISTKRLLSLTELYEGFGREFVMCFNICGDANKVIGTGNIREAFLMKTENGKKFRLI